MVLNTIIFDDTTKEVFNNEEIDDDGFDTSTIPIDVGQTLDEITPTEQADYDTQVFDAVNDDIYQVIWDTLLRTFSRGSIIGAGASVSGNEEINARLVALEARVTNLED